MRQETGHPRIGQAHETHRSVAAYALQCHCPQCDDEGYNYNGRYFKPIEPGDVKRLILAEREWADRMETDLNGYWPRQEMLRRLHDQLNGEHPIAEATPTGGRCSTHASYSCTHNSCGPSPKRRETNGRWMCGSRPWGRSSSIYGIRTCSLLDIITKNDSGSRSFQRELPSQSTGHGDCVFQSLEAVIGHLRSSAIVDGLRWAREPSEAAILPRKRPSLRESKSEIRSNPDSRYLLRFFHRPLDTRRRPI